MRCPRAEHCNVFVQKGQRTRYFFRILFHDVGCGLASIKSASLSLSLIMTFVPVLFFCVRAWECCRRRCMPCLLLVSRTIAASVIHTLYENAYQAWICLMNSDHVLNKICLFTLLCQMCKFLRDSDSETPSFSVISRPRVPAIPSRY